MQRLLTVAYHNSQRLNLLINDLLDIEKLAAGKMHFDLQRHNLTELVTLAININQPLGEERGVRLELLASVPSAVVIIDKDRFLQALSNLQSNAIKFSPERGRVLVSIEYIAASKTGLTNESIADASPINISEVGFWRVRVQDQGEGVPLLFQQRIFEKFAQADSSDSRQKGGTGLGLAITKQLMEGMQGRVGFESLTNQGACFWLDIPVAGEA